MKKVMFLIALCVLAGCKPGADKAISIGQKEVSAVMKDPDSAKFRNVKFIQKDEADDGTVNGYVCGEINSKNSYGAYAGFSPFMVNLAMKSKGIFSTGVTYTVNAKEIYGGDSLPGADYKEICGL
ncbi:hypothetical protein [Kluyvera intermedia]|uniref:Lipoprotein n=1 Tax=Kluyvera intermedia TaxID=61648 RepID=A0AA95JT59_KLUIN|nr:hypothetical protein [Kluyvera intermedia]WGL54589.1 hypothetical protein QBD33_12945 [Kluyvera intermedia]